MTDPETHPETDPVTDPEADPAPRTEPATPGPNAEVLAAICFLTATAAAIGLGVVYWQGGQTQLEGILLAVTTGGIGVGVVVWAKRYMPDEEVTEERKPLESTPEELEAVRRAVHHGDQSVVGRRLLVGSLGAALAALGAALLFPIRSLGPRPGAGLKRTAYAGAAGREGGMRLVRSDGTPLRPDELAQDSVLTVFPDGHTHDADSPTLVIRTREDQQLTVAEGREDWVVDGIVAYSKLCTHVGCPVGLYQSGEGLLLCPCHQSTFDVLDGARPVFGPAGRPLPQLPLGVDDDGYLIATDDFSDPTGAGFWDRGR